MRGRDEARLTRLYLPPPTFSGSEAVLDADASRRLVAVLRLRAGASLRVFDGEGHEREASVLDARRDRAVLGLGVSVEALPEPPVPVTLVCAFPRGQRGDWLVEKATELGVARLVPLEADRAVLRAGDGRLERWRRIAIEAAEQCGRAVVPEIGREPPERNARVSGSIGSGERGPTPFSARPEPVEGGTARSTEGRGSTGSPRTATGSPRTGTGSPRTEGASRTGESKTVELCADLGATTSIQGALTGLELADVTIYIGPEGGWSEAERAEHREAGRVSVTLGPRTLRVETAALAALSQAIEVTGGASTRV